MNAPAYKQDDPATFKWWARALKGQRDDINPNEPMSGFYRARRKDMNGEEKLFAVAYWWHKGRCFCRVNGPGQIGEQPTLVGERHERMIAAWPYAAKEPIEHDVYLDVLAGKPWPDQHVNETTAPAEPSLQPLDEDRQAAPAAGAVAPPAERTAEVDSSPQAVLARDLAEAARGVSRYVRQEPGKTVEYLIDSDAMAGAAQTLRATLHAIHRKAEKALKKANEPYKEAIRKNEEIWSPLEDEATRLANLLRDGPMKQWELDKRANAETAAKASAATGVTVVANTPAPSAQIKGATGKAAAVTETKKAVILDQDAVYAHFRDNDQVKAILQGLATRDVRAGLTVPGTKEEKDVAIR